MTDIIFEDLEEKVTSVVATCNRLREDNNALLDEQADLQNELDELAQKNEAARAEVESILEALQSVELEEDEEVDEDEEEEEEDEEEEEEDD